MQSILCDIFHAGAGARASRLPASPQPTGAELMTSGIPLWHGSHRPDEGRAPLRTPISGLCQLTHQTQRRGIACQASSFASEGRQGLVGFNSGIGTLSYADLPGVSSADAAAEPDKTQTSWWHKFQLRNKRLQRQLKSYGMSGLVAYGLTNTIYYTFAFLFVWLYIVKVPRGLGWTEVGARFVEVMGLTWAYSQVTKVARAAAAVALAPIVDGFLLVLQCRLRLRSKSSTFWLVVAIMLSFAALAIGSVVVIWS